MPELHAPNLPERVEVKELEQAGWRGWMGKQGARTVFLLSHRGEPVTYVMCPPWWDDEQASAALETVVAAFVKAWGSV